MEIWIYLLIILLVLGLCYWCSRFLAKKMGGVSSSSSTKNMRIIERIALGQDKGIAICEICGHYYVIGIASQNIKILLELDAEFFQQQQSEKASFKDVLSQMINNNKDKPQ